MIEIEHVPRPPLIGQPQPQYPLAEMTPGSDESFAVSIRESSTVYLFAKKHGYKVRGSKTPDGRIRFWRIA
jgi:hypothetical protein